jgi:IS605 OrfB family transposase
VSKQIFTYQARIIGTPELEEHFSKYADLYGQVERKLFSAMQSGVDAGKLKSPFLKKYGITARQFNAVSIGLKGKITSIIKSRPALISNIEGKIKKAEKVITKLEKKCPHSNKIHQKKRRFAILKTGLVKMQIDHKDGKARICFGSKKLFQAQFNLEDNGYVDHEAWLKDWQSARANEFTVIGSKDETGGCQGCVATLQPDGALSFRVRVPDSLITDGKYITINDVSFKYGQDVLEKALLLGQAITYRFKRDDKGWRVFVSTEYEVQKTITSRVAGSIGIDINADCLALSEVDRFGNMVASQVVPCITYGKTSDQRKAIIGDAIKGAVQLAKTTGKPISIEKLDFSKKKSELEGIKEKKARMLSSLSYSSIQNTLRSASYRAGVEVIEVNPAYTSTIGAVNYSQRYGISTHQSAAIAIARRGLGFSEKPVKQPIIPVCNGGHVTFPVPARMHGKHVWTQWSAIRTKLSAVHVAHARSGDNKINPAPLKLLASLGSICALSVRFRHTNRQEHCSPGVMDDIPW